MNWTTSAQDFEWIAAIAERVGRMGIDYPQRDVLMDLTAVHANGCPLRLEELFHATPFDFTHDIAGIVRHINRATGKLEGCFVPRYCAKL